MISCRMASDIYDFMCRNEKTGSMNVVSRISQRRKVGRWKIQGRPYGVIVTIVTLYRS